MISLASRITALAITLVVVTTNCTGSEEPLGRGTRDGSRSVDAYLEARLELELDRTREAGGSPGAQATVIWADGTMWTGSSGVADTDGNAPVTDRTLFAMGSTTKAFTAALVLGLTEDGVLSIDDSLARWVPGFPGSDAIALRQLLLHTSGLAQIAGSDIPMALEADPDHHLTTDELILDPVCSPGDCYHYQSPDFGLLGEVVERATGDPFSQQLRRRVLGPLGLDDSYFPSQEKSSGPVAIGYGYGPPTPADEVATLRVEGVDNPYPGAGGGLLATSSDVASFSQALFTGRVLSSGALDDALDFSVTETLPGIDECNAVGLVAVRGSLLEEETWGFGGFTGNFHSSTAFLPRYELSISVVVNDGGDTSQMLEALAKEAIAATEVARPDFVGGSCNYDIYVARSDGTATRRITDDPAIDGGIPSWAPDGRSLAFLSDRTGNGDIFTMTRRGGRVRNLTNSPEAERGVAWSRDGSRIAFWRDRSGHNDIYVMETDGTQVERLTSSVADDIFPAWSPDGSMIAYVSGPAGGKHDLWIMDADGSNARRLTRTETDEASPTWSPDGTRIAYVFDQRVVGGGGIKIFDLSRGKALALPVPLEGLTSPAWGPTDRIAFTYFERDVFIVRPDGTGLVRLTETAGKEFWPAWSPNGRWLAFVSERWQSMGSKPAG
jgi:Tol biopolymer transport system component